MTLERLLAAELVDDLQPSLLPDALEPGADQCPRLILHP